MKAYVENIFARVGLSAGAVVIKASDNDIFSKVYVMRIEVDVSLLKSVF